MQTRTSYLRLAAWFIKTRFGEPSTLRYHHDTWWVWTAGCYRKLSESDLRGIIKQWLGEEQEDTREVAVKETKFAIASLPNVNVSDSVRMPTYIELDSYDDSCNYLALKNRLLDMDTLSRERVSQIFRRPTPNWFSSVVLDFEYNEMAKCPLFLAFLEQVIPDMASRAAMQEWFGYCLTKETDMKAMMILLGESGTGKSTLTNILEALIGPENRSAVPLDRLGGNYAPHQTLNKLVNFCGDADKIDSLPEGLIKMFTGGDTTMIDEKYKPIYSAKMTAKIMAATNVFPKIKDLSEGMWKRFIVVPMDEEIPPEKVDHRYLASESLDWPFRRELPGIFNWAVEGLKRLKKQNEFTTSQQFVQTKAQVRLDNCSLSLFVEERCRANHADLVPVKRFMHEYQCFCESMGLTALNSVQAGKVLRKLFKGLDRKQMGPRANQQWCYIGISMQVPRDE